MKHWYIYQGFVMTGRRFRDDARALGSRPWRVWATWLVVGFLIGIVTMVVLVAVGKALDARGMAQWDRYWLAWFMDYGWMQEHDAAWYQTFGSSAMQLPALALAVTIAIRTGHPLIAATILVVRLVEFPLVTLGWHLWDRPRPTDVQAAIAFATKSGFPSGHAANVICFYGLLAWLWVRHAAFGERVLVFCLMALLVTMVGLSRLAQSMHYPSDVVAGVIVGVVWLSMGIVALQKAEQAARQRGIPPTAPVPDRYQG